MANFKEQMQDLLAAIRLPEQEAAAMRQLYDDVEQALQAVWPGCRAVPFGSLTTGLGTAGSDADVFLDVPQLRERPWMCCVDNALWALRSRSESFSQFRSVRKAAVPLLQFTHLPTGVKCDLSFNSQLGVRNSELVAFTLQSDPRLTPLALLLKHWARVNGILGSGKLTSYALVLLLIFYLQRPSVAILPSVRWLQRNSADELLVGLWNTGFTRDYKNLRMFTNTTPVEDLLGGFFEFYSKFDFEQFSVCTFTGTSIKKTNFADLQQLSDEFRRYKVNVDEHGSRRINISTAVCIQDPFNLGHNVAACIDRHHYAKLVASFKFAAKAYGLGKLDGCKDFLKIILHKIPMQCHLSESTFRDMAKHKRICIDWKSFAKSLLRRHQRRCVTGT